MRLKQPAFYRKVGVRQSQQLQRPRLIPVDKLLLPMETVYHFWPTDTVSVGPDAQDPLFSEVNGRLFIEHIKELSHNEGGPRRTVLNPITMETTFRRKNRPFKPLRKDQALTINPRNLLIVNYAMLSHLYRYIPSFKAEYFRWKNVAMTVWANVERTHQRFGWNQYLELHLPDRIPTYEEFQRISASFNQKTLQAFSGPAEFNLMDLWQWLSDDRQRSSLAQLDDATLDHVNFLVRLKGYFFVINLGQLNAWRKDTDDDADTGISGSVLQRRFIKLLHGLRDLLSGVTQLTDVAVDGDGNPKPVDDSPAPATSMPADSKKEERLPTPPETVAPEKPATADSLLPGLSDDLMLPEAVSSPMDQPAPTFVSPLEKPQAAEDTERAVVLPHEDAGPQATEADPLGLDERLTAGVAAKAWELHDVGLMSAKAYRRSVEDASTYKRLKDPYGSGRSMSDMLEVAQEDLEIPDAAAFPDRDTIPDKSMLQSKLKVMQRSYVRNVLYKDVVSSVMAVQQQGIAVKDYAVETVRDAMNHYEIHTVTLKPVRGRQSTVRFRLPVVDDDGRFMSNGVTYRMRLQRADVPLRKVSPARVALTSYYNKTFVDRSSRATNDYGKWLTRQIVERGLDPEDNRVTEMKLSNVFNMTYELPRVYSLLAKRLGSFRSGYYHFFLDYPKRAEHFRETAGFDTAELETDQQVVIGRYRNHPVLVDFNSTFYIQTDEGLEVVGTIDNLLDIDASKAPSEVAEMSVANKTLPIGFVLAYYLGLNPLVETLGAEVTRFRRGERIPQQSDEYRLTFQDEVLVFSKLDRRATMILSGLNRYQQTLKQYSVWDFDQKDVYYQLLEDAGLGVRYLREIDTLFQSWVDPITRGLLEQMGEPVEFQPLLLRAVELLQTDHSPEEVDGDYMRYRGYERFAGMVYGELTRAAKTFNAKAGMGDNAVEMNPHAVWQKVVQDPAVAPVEESNPFANLREQEVMTYRGDGGRGGKSMVERTRIYHQSDVGVVSESTVDSGDVGVVAYLTPDANFTSLRGTTRPFDAERDGPTRLLSSSALNAPAVDHDDPKRINLSPF